MIAPFELHRPATVKEAASLLAELAPDVAILAGGTELVLVMKFGMADYGHLVDVKRLPELGGLRWTEGALVVGAGVTHREIERSPLVTQRLPILATVAHQVANVRVRSVGTIGGNLSFADPHSDPATLLSALGAVLVSQTSDGASHRRPIEEFLVGPYLTALASDEVLCAIEVPQLPSGVEVGYTRLVLHERPTATAAVRVHVHGNEIVDAAIVIGAVGSVPTRVPGAELAVRGSGAADIGNWGGLVADEVSAYIEPVNDDVPGDYKRHVAGVLAARAFSMALGTPAAP